MNARRSIAVIENFYSDPFKVRAYALSQPFYTPYESREALESGVRPTWWASRFRAPSDCPFKSSRALRRALERAVGERIALAHWNARFEVDGEGMPLTSSAAAGTCLWNCCFHVKPDNGQELGEGVHNHVVDGWNAVGRDGWAGILYLTPDAPLEGGLHLWRNRDPGHEFDWMTAPHNWQSLDSFGNLFNRLVLVRGDIPHSGSRGWGRRLDEGRLYQTFFFRTHARAAPWPVETAELVA